MSRESPFDDRGTEERLPDLEPASRMPLSQGRGPGATGQQQEAPPEFDIAQLRERIDRALEGSPTVETFFERLERDDIHPIPSVQESGRWNGISYEFAGIRVKGSDLGRAYTPKGLCEKKALSYVPDRDTPRLRDTALKYMPTRSIPHCRERSDRERPQLLISAAEERVLWEAGRFRTVAEPDLARSHYAGNHATLQHDLRHLASLGFIERHKVAMDRSGRTLSVVALTRQGKALLKDDSARGSGPTQSLYVGVVKPRELAHDTAIYRMYLAEASRIEAKGGRIRRVVLDYELKQRAYSPLAKAIDLPPLEYTERQQQIADENGLAIVDGHIVLPDLRIEYETPDGDVRQLDLELTTRNYRAAHIRSKAGAGFKIYADTSSGRLSAVLDDHDLVAELLRI